MYGGALPNSPVPWDDRPTPRGGGNLPSNICADSYRVELRTARVREPIRAFERAELITCGVCSTNEGQLTVLRAAADSRRLRTHDQVCPTSPAASEEAACHWRIWMMRSHQINSSVWFTEFSVEWPSPPSQRKCCVYKQCVIV